MGIHQFYGRWLRNRKKGWVLKRNVPGRVCSLMIDMNSIIHRTVPKIYAIRQKKRPHMRPSNRPEEIQEEEEITRREKALRSMAGDKWTIGKVGFGNWLLELEEEHFIAITNELLKILHAAGGNNPGRKEDTPDILIISIDGAAPLAKIKQQRSRRFRSGKKREKSTMRNAEEVARLTKKRGRAGGKVKDTYPWPLFDTNAITPGTEFMFRLDKYLREWFDKQAVNLPPTTIYYSHMVPGEGEHRIMDDIRSGKVGSCRRSNGAHVIYGSDSDLAMLGLIAPLDRLYIVRDDFTDVIDIAEFRLAVYDIMGTQTALADFVLMFFLIGNDFLPRPPSLSKFWESMDTLIDIYRRANGVEDKVITPGEMPPPGKYPLTNPENPAEVNWEGVSIFLQMVAEIEPQLLENEAKHPPNIPSKILEKSTITVKEPTLPGAIHQPPIKKTVNYSVYRLLWYTNALLPKIPFDQMNSLDRSIYGEPPQVDLAMVENMVINYIQGIGWINTYYHKGLSGVNIDWFYQWDHTPLFKDIATVINRLERIPTYTHIPGTEPVNVIYQLLMVLPPSSKDLLPDQVIRLLEPGSSIADIYPVDFQKERDGIMAKWMGIVLLPPFQPERIIQAVADEGIQFSESDIRKYNAVVGVDIVRSSEIYDLIRTRQKLEQYRTRYPVPSSTTGPRRGGPIRDIPGGRRGGRLGGRRGGRLGGRPGERQEVRQEARQVGLREQPQRPAMLQAEPKQPFVRPGMKLTITEGKVLQPATRIPSSTMGNIGGPISERSFANIFTNIFTSNQTPSIPSNIINPTMGITSPGETRPTAPIPVYHDSRPVLGETLGITREGVPIPRPRHWKKPIPSRGNDDLEPLSGPQLAIANDAISQFQDPAEGRLVTHHENDPQDFINEPVRRSRTAERIFPGTISRGREFGRGRELRQRGGRELRQRGGPGRRPWQGRERELSRYTDVRQRRLADWNDQEPLM